MDDLFEKARMRRLDALDRLARRQPSQTEAPRSPDPEPGSAPPQPAAAARPRTEPRQPVPNRISDFLRAQVK